MFDVFYCGKKPNLFAFERFAESLDRAAELSRTRLYWFIYTPIDTSAFDFDYIPPPWEEDHIHVWPNQWRQYGNIYLVNKHTVDKQQWHFHTQIVKSLPSPELFDTKYNLTDFDYSWTPHPMDPPYIYVFGNQWYEPEQMPTVEYHTPGATEKKYMYEPQAQLAPTRENWILKEDVPLDFDFSWCPDPHDPPYIYVFGNQHWSGERSPTVEYHTPGATERKYIGDVQAKLSTLDIFFVDHGNLTAESQWIKLSSRYPHAQRTRFANTIIDTVTRCAKKSRTARFWVVSSNYDLSDFDFDWQPEPWQQSMTHVFPSQHQQWSDTFLINRWEFERHSQWANGLEQFPNLNFVTDQTVKKTDNNCDIFYIDHGNPESGDQYRNLVQKLAQNVVKTRFVDNYLATFRRIMSVADSEYVWIINSTCDYQHFDFTWEPEPWQREMIHVFPSGLQDRGDTFYIHVESFKQQIAELEILDWFNVINYCRDQQVQRFPTPVVNYEGDDLISAIKEYQFTAPYALFRNHNPIFLPYIDPCLWSERDRVVTRHNTSGSISLVPRDIKRYLQTQIYDYPYIDSNRRFPFVDIPLDIIYISNGEPDEAKWYEHTCRMTYNGVEGSVKWIRGVNGRTAAYQAAARASTTPWFFAVFAKLEVVGDEFDWRNWQPDYFQGPKHYIFRARNPMNGLEYGHQGVIAYNKNLVLANNTPGIDFTLSQPHESVPITLGTAHFNQDPWMTWRTAFREVVKLKHFMAVDPTVETEHRLHVWTTQASGDYAEYCLAGARDAVEYYEEVSGDYEKLKLSFEWAWLRERFNGKN